MTKREQQEREYALEVGLHARRVAELELADVPDATPNDVYHLAKSLAEVPGLLNELYGLAVRRGLIDPE